MTNRSSGTYRVAASVAGGMLALLNVVAPPEASATRSLPGNGPFGGDVEALTYSPPNPDIVLAASGQGIFRSEDGGLTWVRSLKQPRTLYVDGFVFHPTKQNVVYTHPHGARSRDGGQTWRGELRSPPGRTGGTALAFTDNGRTVFSLGLVHLVASNDDGKTWRFLKSTPGLGYQICGFAFHGAGRGTLYLAAPYETKDGARAVGLFRSDDGGRSWSRRSIGTCPTELIVSPDKRNLLYAVHGTSDPDRVERSADGGKTWRRLDVPLEGSRLTVAESAPRVLYAVGTSPGEYTRSIVRSHDRGRTWGQVSSVGNTRHTSYGRLPLTTHPTRTDVVLLGGNQGVQSSADGGRTFTASNTGLSATMPKSLAFSRHDASLVYASTAEGLYRSRDGGASWSEVGSSFMEEQTRYGMGWIRDIEVDAAAHIYVSYHAPAPSEATHIYRSMDQGDSWGQLSDLDAGILLGHPAAPGVLFAGTPTGLWVTRDGGHSWTATTLPAQPVSDLAYDASTGATYVLMTDGPFNWQGDSILYRTDNFGVDWTKLASPPLNATTIAAQGRTIFAGGNAYAVARSRNGGESWKTSDWIRTIAFPEVIDLAIDPLDPTRIVASTDRAGLISSRDQGESWDPLEDTYPRSAGAIEFLPTGSLVDPVLSQRPLFAGIGGVWRIIPGPSPEHRARIEGEVRPGNTVTCESGEWRRTDTVTYAWFGIDAEPTRIEGADDKTFQVPKPSRDLYQISCRASGKGPGGRYRTDSSFYPIRT